MPTVARTEVDSGLPCPNCGRALPPGTSACPACGAAHGAANRCPHCRATADVEPHPTLGFRCLVCGGPRIAMNAPAVSLSATTEGALVDAGKEQTASLMLSAAGYALSGIGALGLLLATVVVQAATLGDGAAALAYLAAAVPVGAGAWALTRAGRARKRREHALHAAQVSALGDAQATLGPLSAPQVAELMRLGPERVEHLLAEASVASLLADAPPRLRVEPLAPSPGATELGGPDEEALADARAQAPRGRTES